jgi:hypothetical protein
VLPSHLTEAFDKGQQQILRMILQQQAGIVRSEHFDAKVLQQIQHMDKGAVNVALRKLLNKQREVMQGVRCMPAYFTTFFRNAQFGQLKLQ